MLTFQTGHSSVSKTGKAKKARTSYSLQSYKGQSPKWTLVIVCLSLVVVVGSYVQSAGITGDDDNIDSETMSRMMANARDVASMPDFEGRSPSEYGHDDLHPDHVDGHDEHEFQPDSESFSQDDEPNKKLIIRHRKVYLTEENPIKSIIHPISLTIPLKLNGPLVRPPKPVFRMHKYTTYEKTPEVKMVPMKTTVIKPAGVSDDQILNHRPYQKLA